MLTLAREERNCYKKNQAHYKLTRFSDLDLINLYTYLTFLINKDCAIQVNLSESDRWRKVSDSLSDC